MKKTVCLFLLFVPIFSCSNGFRDNKNRNNIKIISDQCFNIFIEDFDDVHFVTSIDNWVHFSLTIDGNTVYTFPKIEQGDYFNPKVEAVSFYDADKDNRKDVLIIIKVNSKAGKAGSFNYIKILFINTAYKSFEETREMNELPGFSEIKTMEGFKRIIDHYYTYQTLNIGSSRKWKSLNQYFGDEHTRKNNLHVILDNVVYYDTAAISIRGKNLIIEGGANTWLYGENKNDNVMWLSGETNVVLRKLKMKHKAEIVKEWSNCTGRVLAFDVAYDIIIDSCEFNGSGLAGLHDNVGNKNLLIMNSSIHNCSLGAYTDSNGNVWQEPTEHQVFKFVNTRMYNNGPERIIEKD